MSFIRTGLMWLAMVWLYAISIAVAAAAQDRLDGTRSGASTFIDLKETGSGDQPVRLPPGRYLVEASVEPEMSAWSRSIEVASKGAQRLLLDRNERSRTFDIDLAAFDLGACCVDGFRELHVRYRDINPFNPIEPRVRLAYEKHVVVRPGGTHGSVLSRIIARTGPAEEAAAEGDLAWDAGKANWSRRALLYPVWRMVGVSWPDEVHLTPTADNVVAQVLPDLELTSTKDLQFRIADCGELTELNLRFRTSRGSVLKTGMLARATASRSVDGAVLTLPMAEVRDLVGVGSDEAIHLSEIIGFFRGPLSEIVACKPLRAVMTRQYEVGGVRTSTIELPSEIDAGTEAVKVLRVRQSVLGNEANWGYRLASLQVVLSQAGSTAGPGGIEVVDVGLVNPDSLATTAGKAPTGAPCERELRAVLGASSDTTRLASYCPTSVIRHRFSTTSLDGHVTAKSTAGVLIEPTDASFRVSRLDGGIGIDIDYANDRSQLVLQLDALGSKPYPRIVRLAYEAGGGLTVRATKMLPRSASGALTFIVEAGQTPAIIVGREPSTESVATRHALTLQWARAAAVGGHDEKSSSQARDRSTSQEPTERLIDWGSGLLSALKAGSDSSLGSDSQIPLKIIDDTLGLSACADLQGIGICGSQGVPRLVSSAHGLAITTIGQSRVDINLPTPIKLSGRSLFRFEAVADDSGSSLTGFELNLTTESGKTLTRTVMPSMPLWLFSTDEVVTNARLSLSRPPGASDVNVVESLFASLGKVEDLDFWNVPVQQKERLSPAVEGEVTVARGLSSDVDGASVVVSGVVLGEDRVLAEWGLPINVRRNAFAGLVIEARWTEEACRSWLLAVDLESGSERHSTTMSLCGIAGNTLEASAIMPPRWPLDAVIDRVRLRVISRGAAFPPVPVYGSVSTHVMVDRFVTRAETIFAHDLVEMNGRRMGLKRRGAGMSDAVDQLRNGSGKRLPLGSVDIGSSGHLVVRDLEHPALSVRSLRLTPEKLTR